MAVLRRPKLKKREPDVQSSWTPPGPASQPAPQQQSYIPSPSAEPSGRGISVRELNEALGIGTGAGGEGGGSLLGGGGGGFAGGGINTRDLGVALTGSGSAAGNRSAESTRHTSYPQGKGDLRSLPAKAGTRKGPRTTSYRIPLQRNSQANVFDTIN